MDEEVNKIADKFETIYFDSLIIYGEPLNETLKEVTLFKLGRFRSKNFKNAFIISRNISKYKIFK